MQNINISVRPMTSDDQIPVMDIFNYYIENSFAAYLEKPLGYEFYERMLASTQGFPTAILESLQFGALGFGFLRAYHPMPAFRHTAEISYFIKPGYTRKGLGAKMLNQLLGEAAHMGIKTVMAQICSLNQASIDFHLAQGFTECGRFLGVGQKKQQSFDVVWMQRCL